MKLEGELARMMTCTNLGHTLFSCSDADHRVLHQFIARIGDMTTWDVCYYDVLLSQRKKQVWICQKYGATVCIETSRGNLTLSFRATYELTEVVEEREVHCSVVFPDEASSFTLLRSRSERWIEESKYATQDTEGHNGTSSTWERMRSCLLDGTTLDLSVVVALVFRLVSAPTAAWSEDNW
eukprot:CAMPEP_0181441158 /NCGR_PEP_ID=MMETSP1110-20121109/23359_1 /TAXON_ID=174948 /ORGANISM="Symbiodinium sp., Strain CCMP421" /LENGTH=180 /DNA_ID=CAMNT_0023565025 /DNA_START=366 /DNA_END=905 /DNA_ORIENTATION=+